MSKANCNNDIYKMYEKELNKNIFLTKDYKRLKLDYGVLKSNFDNLKINFEKKTNSKVKKATTPLFDKIKDLEEKLNSSHDEIE